MPTHLKRLLAPLALAALLSGYADPLLAASSAEPYREWIAGMKTAERGPFARIRWFCADGSVLPPEPYACRDHGGGRQHGEHSERTQTLRDAGYKIANVLAALPPDEALADQAELLKWTLLERFLVETDDGWILRRARFYRGALQIENEAAAARELLETMLGEERYRTTHFLLLREAARLLPWQQEGAALDKARSLASTIAKEDPGFGSLRNKIHSHPERDDIERVRRYAARTDDPARRGRLEELVSALERTYRSTDLAPRLRQLAGDRSDTAWNQLAEEWRQAAGPETRLAVAARILATLREQLGALPARQRLTALGVSLAAEQEAFAAGRGLITAGEQQSRQWHLTRLTDNLDALYGIGFLTEREWRAQRERLAAMPSEPRLADYRERLDYLARIPAWTDTRFDFLFRPQLRRFSEIEPLIEGFVPDRLRGSPLLLHGQLLETLAADADRLAGVRHELFGRSVSVGLRSLNPGMARGQLQRLSEHTAAGAATEAPIVLAPETIADLPPVSGILTAREGNALSHVQLLARNLGLPNVVVGAQHLPEIERRIGERVVLLSSPGGVVQLHRDEPRWDASFPKEAEKPAVIQVDLDKLDLGVTEPVSLKAIRSEDSGRIVGPKAAKLGELMAHFPDRMSPGLAIPFGVFREHLNQPIEPGGPSLFDWMRRNYARLDSIALPEIRQRETDRFLENLRNRIRGIELDEDFRQTLRARMRDVFGDSDGYGVFVRSDTNVEDLPGFTGAGLNLTVFNVVGFEAVLDAIRQVWASPFTDRAFGWRQALMTKPEHVYASVLLHKTVPADKSGVMVTADLATNHAGSFSIAVNEGLGGGVEGQAAESLRVDAGTGETHLLATAGEPHKWIAAADGGTRRAPATGSERVLDEAEIRTLVEFGRSLAQRYPPLRDARGEPAPADVEFAFHNGDLYLIQIRPFLQSDRAQRNRVLAELDTGLRDSIDRRIDLTQRPGRDVQP